MLPAISIERFRAKHSIQMNANTLVCLPLARHCWNRRTTTARSGGQLAATAGYLSCIKLCPRSLCANAPKIRGCAPNKETHHGQPHTHQRHSG